MSDTDSSPYLVFYLTPAETHLHLPSNFLLDSFYQTCCHCHTTMSETPKIKTVRGYILTFENCCVGFVLLEHCCFDDALAIFENYFARKDSAF